MRPEQTTDPGMNAMTPPPVGANEEVESTTPWQDIKSRFVDDPSGAIAAAEEQVRRALDQRIRALKAEVDELCAQDHDGDEASNTEGLRTRLIRYQEYCERLPH